MAEHDQVGDQGLHQPDSGIRVRVPDRIEIYLDDYPFAGCRVEHMQDDQPLRLFIPTTFLSLQIIGSDANGLISVQTVALDRLSPSPAGVTQYLEIEVLIYADRGEDGRLQEPFFDPRPLSRQERRERMVQKPGVMVVYSGSVMREFTLADLPLVISVSPSAGDVRIFGKDPYGELILAFASFDVLVHDPQVLEDAEESDINITITAVLDQDGSLQGNYFMFFLEVPH